MMTLESLRGKYIYWSIKGYLYVMDLWYQHIKEQQEFYWSRIDPELRRRVERELRRQIE